MKAVKDIIKEKRLEHNLTMKELAQKVGVSEGTISRWESGEIANMRRGAMVALSKVLEIPPAVLMGWDKEDVEREKKNDAIPVLDDPDIRILARNSQVTKDPEKRAMLKRVLKTMLEDAEHDK
ncbi:MULTISPECIES: helix-turn-helix domain-containing protein [unclassified Megasphaera]|uniref:helix-turn-helix domain-containing protein n=1 Tax=unclassified Megasphaera TaxID=2626256 RepID=UPI0003F619C7|nr:MULTISPECIES: helix-turn-helix transcriptional regulator [unclassified Megasphaera]